MVKSSLAVVAVVIISMGWAGAFAQAPPVATEDGITKDMMPITPEQIAACRDQATQQPTDEQGTVRNREHSLDSGTGSQGPGTSVVSRGHGGWWGGNSKGPNAAAATGSQRMERDGDHVTETDAYTQCVNGIKGQEYVHFRQTGRITAHTLHPSPKADIRDEGDGKHAVLMMPGDANSKELTRLPGNDKAFMDPATGDKYVQMPDGSVTHIRHVARKAS